MLRRTCIVFTASLALAGCNLANKEVQVDDASNPHYKQAQQDLDAGNPTAAAADYEVALSADPKLAGAEYNLGLIYGDKLADPVASIYHYKRFLELAPGSDKADQVKAQIDKQGLAFAASLPAPAAAQGSADVTQLQSDNAALKQQLADAAKTISKLQSQLAQGGKHHAHLAMQSTPPPAQEPAPLITQVALTDDTNAPATGTAPAAPMRATPVDTNAPDVNAVPPSGTGAEAAPIGPTKPYTIVKGDKLWKIAHKMYPGDTKNGVDKIMAANPGLDPKKLKPGQVIQIPK